MCCHQRQLMPKSKTRRKVRKKPASANPSGIRRGRKPYPIDADGNKIRPEKENQKTGQKQKKSK